ncbi:RES family NAD+ phosphorylase [Pseudomonas sp. WS 5413]|uniref:RES domain-containing protein n=1 Tax=Pseudomonas sp. WS 5413 TaxID=2717488 RepID=UPI001472C38A|nr:RES family NAD+ phosphorylase [Pseudomonas sp. WS 5413]
MIDKSLICELCASDNELRLEIQERGVHAKRCPTCDKKDVKTLSANDHRLKRIVRALVRVNYSEWDYNNHIGGSSLYTLLCRDKFVFDFDEATEHPLPDEVWCPIEQELGWYPKSAEDITLGGGYWDGGILSSVRGNHSGFVPGLVNQALKDNYFEVESVVRKKIKKLSPYLVQVISAGAEYYRGRVGVSMRLSPKFVEPGYPPEYKYQPYRSIEIERPPLHLATEGRFNRTRVSVLYLASDALTAVSELRPHPGHLISTSKFRLVRDLTIANFSSFDVRNFLSDDKLEILRDLMSIADILNVPVQPEHNYLYSLTQLFADSLRLEGFEGLAFQSSVGTGINLTCFSSDAFTPIKGSEAVCKITSLTYETIEMPVLGDDYDKQEYEPDENSPLSTLLHSMTKKK